MAPRLDRRSFLAASSAAAFAACNRSPAPNLAGFAFVANEQGRAVAAVDLAALAVVKHISLAASPARLIGIGQRKAVYALTPENGTIHEIASSALERRRWTAACRSAVDMHSINPDSIWILGRDPWELIEVTLDKLEPRRRIPMPHPVSDFDLSLEGDQAVVAFTGQDRVGLVELSAGRIRMTGIGAAVRRVRFRKDGRQWIAAHLEDKLLTIADAASGQIVVRLPLAMVPEQLCFKDDGGELYVTGSGSDAMAIVFPYSTEVAETILAGHNPGAMAYLAKTKESNAVLFVTNPKSRQLTVFNIEDRKVAAVVQVGSEPSQVVITPDNTFALVLNRESGDMAILARSVARKRAFPATLLTVVPVGSRPVDAVVLA